MNEEEPDFSRCNKDQYSGSRRSESIRQRIKAGMQQARAAGKRIGRPPVDQKIKDAVLNMRRGGRSYGQIARDLGISRNSVTGIVRRARNKKNRNNQSQ